MPTDKLRFDVICLSNNRRILEANLLSSPDISQHDVFIIENPTSATVAYNKGISSTTNEYMLFIHQDVFLPSGWFENAARQIRALERTRSEWGLLGIFGTNDLRQHVGYIYSTGLQRVIGRYVPSPVPVQCVDEVAFIAKRGSGLLFDAKLSGFHLYAADFSLQCKSRGLPVYVIPAFCIHNTNGIAQLPTHYWSAALYLRRKWRKHLPIHTPCMSITRWMKPAISYCIRTLLRSKHSVGRRLEDPKSLLCSLENEIATLQRNS